MNKELSELISDLKEQVLYLQELGVNSLNADLPDFKVENLPITNSQSAVRKSQSEYVVPDFQFPAKTETKPAEKPKTNSLSSETSRLSRLPTISNRPVFNSEKNSPVNSVERHIETAKVAEPKAVVQSPTETLYGDITQTLPESTETLADIKEDIGKNCQRCRLCEKRTQVVNSVGNSKADLMFIGEAPGADEDLKGEPFVGKAGQLLNKIIEAIGMKREEVFIGNINRCRPPQNRQPQTDEAAICKPFLIREIAIVRPKVIVVLGNTACQNLLDTKVGITKLRGNFQDYYGVKVMPTFHPSYLLREPSKKREVWEDMKKVRDYLNDLE